MIAGGTCRGSKGYRIKLGSLSPWFKAYRAYEGNKTEGQDAWEGKTKSSGPSGAWLSEG